MAFLAGTVRLGPNGMSYRPRMQPLQVPRDTKLVAVVRIETTAGVVFKNETAKRVAQEIAQVGRLPAVVAVQVDFDATASERVFYRDLLGGTEAATASIYADFHHRTQFLVHRRSVDDGTADR